MGSMATKYSYPGVYVEEIPSGERSIAGVSTSVTAFVGFTQKGPVNKAVRLHSFGDYERSFGGLSVDSEIGYQVRQYFLNGGTQAYVVRTAKDAVASAVRLKQSAAGAAVLEVTAISEGTWGNYVRIDVDYAASNPDSEFNLTVTEYKQQGTSLVESRKETHRNLSMSDKSGRYAVNVINPSSQLIQVSRVTVPADVTSAHGWSLSGKITATEIGKLDDDHRFVSIAVDGATAESIELFPAGATAPADLDDLVDAIQTALDAKIPGCTVSRATALGVTNIAGEYVKIESPNTGQYSSVAISNSSIANAAAVLGMGLLNGGREMAAAALMRPAQTGLVSGDLAALDLSTLSTTDQISVSVSTSVLALGSGNMSALGEAATTLSGLRKLLEERIRAINPSNPALKSATVQVTGTRLRIVSSTDTPEATITIANVGGGDLATDLQLTGSAASSNVQRYALGGSSVAAQEQVAGGLGSDGTVPEATHLIGAEAAKTGIYALEDVDVFNILSVPRTGLFTAAQETDALMVIEAAAIYAAKRRAFAIIDPPEHSGDVTAMETWLTKLTPDKNAAVYFPWVQVPDPLDGYRLRSLPPSGTIAGLYARIDGTRGVWKAPAGTEATLRNVQGLAYSLTDAENGVLNPQGINCLRSFPTYGRVCWGARTLEGADAQASEWKYVPVRRLALYIEESLFQGTQWVVFEPNDEPLWAQIRLSVGAFMHRLFRQGAFQGSTPKEAYFVKCDSEVTTQDDIDQGIVNIVVGFAPLKPAEFVVIKLQQIAGQAQS